MAHGTPLPYISDPAKSVPKLMQCLERFGFYSGYKINMSKTEALPMTNLISTQLKTSSLFRWPREGIWYLGINIPPDLNLYQTNYARVVGKKINRKKDINRWATLPLTLIGRVETIRMNLLPRFLFIFQTLPVAPPKSMFTLMDRLISRFIWLGKRPRVRYKVLQLAKSKGGLGLPNLKYYWIAAQLRAMTVWLSDNINTRWLCIEKSCSSNMPLSVIPFIGIKLIRDFPGEWSRITYGAWREVQQMFKLPIGLSSLSSISYIKDFLPLKLDIGFKNWAHSNLRFVHQLFSNNNFKSFDQIRAEFSLSKTEHYRYLQLRSFINNHPNRNSLKEPTPLEQYLSKIQEGNHTQRTITNLYTILTSMTKDNTCHVKEKWDRELHQEISEEGWIKICAQIHTVTNSNSWREFQWKIVNRFFRTPETMAKMNSNQKSTCWRGCGETIANYSHIFWQCPLLDNFWKSIFAIVNKALQIELPRDPLIAILGMKPEVILNRKMMYILQIVLIAAKKAITLRWLKQALPPMMNGQ